MFGLGAKRIGVMASIGEGNLGDELILCSLLQQLRTFHTGIIDVYSNDLLDTINRIDSVDGLRLDEFSSRGKIPSSVNVFPFLPVGVRSFVNSVINNYFLRIVFALFSTSDVIVGGGGILYSQETNRGINPLLIWLIKITLVRLTFTRVHLVSVGVEHVSGWWSRLLLRLIVSLCKTINVRDLGSARMIRSCGVSTHTEISVMHDIVFDLDMSKFSILDSMTDTTIDPAYTTLPSCGKGIVGVVVREWGSKQGDDAISFWRDVVEGFRKKGFAVVLIPLSYHCPDDRDFVKRIAESGCDALPWEGPYTFDGWFSLLSVLDGIVSVRLHGVISALLARKKVVSLGYGNKTKSLAERFDLPFGWLDCIEAEEVVDLYLNADASREVSLSFTGSYSQYLSLVLGKNPGRLEVI